MKEEMRPIRAESADNNRSRTPGLLDLFGQQATRNYLFVAAAALAVYYGLASARAQGAGGHGDLGVMMAVVITIPGLLGRWTVSPGVFLIMSTYLLIDPNFGNMLYEVGVFGRGFRPVRPDLGLRPSDLLLAGSILVYLMAQFRLLSFINKSLPEDPPPRRKGQGEPAVPRRPHRLFGNVEVGIVLLLAACCTVTGFICWLTVAAIENYAQPQGGWGIRHNFVRLLLFGWGFASALAAATVFFRYLDLRRMSRTEARLLLQDGFWQETRREQERIFRWRQWFGKPLEKQEIDKRS